MLHKFFNKTLSEYMTPDLDTLGKRIIQCCLDKGTVEDFISLVPMTF